MPIVGVAGLAIMVVCVLLLVLSMRLDEPSVSTKRQVFAGFAIFWFGAYLALSVFLPKSVWADVLRIIAILASVSSFARSLVESVRDRRRQKLTEGRRR